MKSYQSKLLLAALSLIFVDQIKAEDPFSVWVALNSPTYTLTESLDSKTNFEVRFPDGDQFSYYRISQKFYTKLSENWTLGSHPVFENSKKGSEWITNYRLDIELNPAKISLGENGPQLSMRNRWEFHLKEGTGGSVSERIRHQSKLTWKLSKGPFSSYSISDEIFFEKDKGKLTANRFYPLILTKKHGESFTGTYFLMYQHKRSGTTSNWNGEYILGTAFSF